MAASLERSPLETEGNILSTRFHIDKAAVVTCLQASIESFLAAKKLSREYLAENLCGMSLANFSKLSNGLQGDVLGFIFEKLPGDIKDDFMERLAALNRIDPMVQALEHLVSAAFRVIALGQPQLPARADRMAKVDAPAQKKRTA